MVSETTTTDPTTIKDTTMNVGALQFCYNVSVSFHNLFELNLQLS